MTQGDAAEEQTTDLFRPGKVSYLEIPCTDSAASAAFYEAVFAWSIHARPGGECAFEDAPHDLIGHFITSRRPSGEDGVRPYIYVSSVDVTLQRIASRGCMAVTSPYQEGDLWVATFRDPAGNVIGIWQRGPR